MREYDKKEYCLNDNKRLDKDINETVKEGEKAPWMKYVPSNETSKGVFKKKAYLDFSSYGGYI